MSAVDPRSRFSGRALLIEDNAIVALNAEDALSAMGFGPIDIASSIAQAGDFIRTHTYAAAVVDLMLKDGSAASIAEALIIKGVAVVITSGYDDLSSAPNLDAIRVSKPYDDDMLRAALLEASQRQKLNL